MSDVSVFVVDDDEGVRRSIRLLLETAGHQVSCFDSGESFLRACRPDWHGCMILDISMPGMSGLALQKALIERGIGLPVIFLTAHGDIPSAVQAMRLGAQDFLTKPVSGAALLTRVAATLGTAAAQHEPHLAHESAPAGLEQLTPRETEVMRLAMAGQQNKEIARALGISHRTVEYHRTRILAKTGASSFVKLAAMAAHNGNLGED